MLCDSYMLKKYLLDLYNDKRYWERGNILDKRYRAIDFMKGIAMIMVILVHYEQSFGLCHWFWYLQMGCAIFFLCSGFSIMSLINKKFNGVIDKTNIKAFYFSRIKALAPGWYFAIAIIFVINTVLIGISKNPLPFGTNRDVISIICNLLFLNGFLPFCNNNVVPGGWYIGTTVILYMLTPFILWLLKKTRHRGLFFVISSMIDMAIWFVLANTLQEFWGMGDGYTYFVFFVHYPSFLLGMLLYESVLRKEQSRKVAIRFLILGVFTLVIAVFFFYAGYYGISLPYGNILSSWATALYAYLFLKYLICKEKQSEEKSNFCSRFVCDFGQKSYGIFLLHAFYVWPFIKMVEQGFNYIGKSIINIWGFLTMIPIVIVFCYLTGIAFSYIDNKIKKAWF